MDFDRLLFLSVGTDHGLVEDQRRLDVFDLRGHVPLGARRRRRRRRGIGAGTETETGTGTGTGSGGSGADLAVLVQAPLAHVRVGAHLFDFVARLEDDVRVPPLSVLEHDNNNMNKRLSFTRSTRSSHGSKLKVRLG